MVCDADLGSSTKAQMFGDAYPERFFQVGIAEQNMVGIAAGLATMGFVAFTSTFACFASKRVTDQVRVMVAQPELTVMIMGAYSGCWPARPARPTRRSRTPLSIGPCPI